MKLPDRDFYKTSKDFPYHISVGAAVINDGGVYTQSRSEDDGIKIDLLELDINELKSIMQEQLKVFNKRDLDESKILERAEKIIGS